MCLREVTPVEKASTIGALSLNAVVYDDENTVFEPSFCWVFPFVLSVESRMEQDSG